MSTKHLKAMIDAARRGAALSTGDICEAERELEAIERALVTLGKLGWSGARRVSKADVAQAFAVLHHAKEGGK